jgi:cobalamin biosynthesis protein CobT
MNKAYAISKFSAIYKDDCVNGAVRAKLIKLLKNQDMVSWSKREESGRIDRKAFPRFAAGSAAIFARRALGEADTAAVSVMVDCSYSMKDSTNTSQGLPKCALAQQLVIQLAKVFSKTDAAFSITGFKGRARTNRYGDVEMEVQSLELVPFKGWGESIQTAAPRLGAMYDAVDKGTPDYAGVLHGINDIAARPERRKVLFIITDAEAYYPPHMQYLQSLADKRGVKIIALGISTDDAAKCFRNAARVDSIENLSQQAFSRLLETLK